MSKQSIPVDQILNCPLGPNDAKAATVKDFLKALLIRLWEEGEGFSGKRPFGNSGWEYPLYLALVKNKLVKGEYSTYNDGETSYDEEDNTSYDELDSYDEKAANKLIFEAIKSL